MDPPPRASSHVHRSNMRKRAATGTWIHVQEPTATYTGITGKNEPKQACGITSKGLQPRAQVEQAEKGGHRQVDRRPGAYSHVQRSNRLKRTDTGTLIHYSQVNRSNMRKRAATGTWIHVHMPPGTCTGRTCGKGRRQARESTSKGL